MLFPFKNCKGRDPILAFIFHTENAKRRGPTLAVVFYLRNFKRREPVMGFLFGSKTAKWYESHTSVSANSSTLPNDSILVKSGPSPEITTLTKPKFSPSKYSKMKRVRENVRKSKKIPLELEVP